MHIDGWGAMAGAQELYTPVSRQWRYAERCLRANLESAISSKKFPSERLPFLSGGAARGKPKPYILFLEGTLKDVSMATIALVAFCPAHITSLRLHL